jgi:hypothetical protein
VGDTEQPIAEVLAVLEPTLEQKDGAVRSHNYLRERLEEKRIGSRILDHYLSGSYARDTAIQPLDDVDIIFVVDPTFWDRSILSSRPSPEAVLRTFQGAIRYRYQESSLRLQRVSVRLSMNHLDIDVVPAIADESGDGELIHIPDRYENKWVLTAPRKHTWYATDVNKRQGGLFKPLVKLLKGWNGGLPASAQMKGFAVETMAVRIFSETRFTTLDEGLLKFWDFLAWQGGDDPLYSWKMDFGIGIRNWTPQVPDVAETGSNTLGRPTRDECKRFLSSARRSRDFLAQAFKARTQEGTEALVYRALRAT